ncbi:TIGR03545 family protein [Teredinibacter haidensis]|uniref:TIGR03545 family protein n=1 Tax=Teredinibacter haidensis TaxID=2731755 RepID=UPI0009491391|nr:TIGR03545 family protein [Teredinibacter haidensis]
MKAIRWSGFLGFIVVVTLIFVVTHFFVDGWIKRGVQSLASEAVGAEVNVGSVSHSYMPFGVTLQRVQVTDPENPSLNKVELAEVAATLDVLPLLMEKVIIDELTVSELQFGTVRAKPGKVYRGTAENEGGEKEKGEGLNIELPSVDEVLAKATLKTETARTALQQSYEEHDTQLRDKYAALPNEKVLKSYETKIKALQARDVKNPQDFLAAQKELKQLKDELKAEKTKLKDFKQAVDGAKSGVGSDISTLKTASKEDYDKLKGLLAGDLAAFGEITSLLFGEQARVWSERLFSAYELVVPMLEGKKEQVVEEERAKGRWIEFTDAEFLPDFLVRKANVSLLWDGQSFESIWQDITTEHDLLGRATQFRVASLNTKKWKALNVDGDFWLAEAGVKANQKWKLQDVVLNKLPLAAQDILTGQLEKASLNSSGSLSIRDNMLDGKGVIDLVDLVLQMEGRNTFASNVAKTLNQLKNIKMDAGLSGMLDEPEFNLGSDLDAQIRKAFASGAGAEGQGKLDELQQKLNSMAADQLGESGAKLADWKQWQDLAQGKTGTIEKMLEAEMESKVDKQKDKLKDELKKRLFN